MLFCVFQFFSKLLTQEPESHIKTIQSSRVLQSFILILTLRSTETAKRFGLVNLFLEIENKTVGTKFGVHMSCRKTAQVLVKKTKARA